MQDYLSPTREPINVIEVSSLVFEYLGHRALHHINVQIGAGTVTALVGPNGAGKSTLLRCMAGLEQPLSGHISIEGVSVRDFPRQVHRHIGYLSDFYGLYDRLSVARCLNYAALSMGMAPEQATLRVDQVAEQLGLSHLLERRPTELSRGQRQRVAIGQAIVHMPSVLLLDEPASGLDPDARSSLSQLFLQLQSMGMTLVVSSHILSELDAYCTHILSLRDGHVESHEGLQPMREQGKAAAPSHALYALEIACAIPVPLQPALAGLLQQAESVDFSGQSAWQLWLPVDKADRAAWLAQLMQAGVNVCALWPERVSLQQRYAQRKDKATR